MVTAGAPHVTEGDLVAGRYRLLRPIGAGAMGTVWAARHELLGRDFALKLATIEKRAGPEARARFLREAQIVGKLRHPNVVDVADVGDVGVGAGLYLAMELLEGQSLAEHIDEDGPLDPPEALAIASEVCRGLAAAHAAGVVHRDIKPENIFLARAPSGGMVPKVLDFGISKARDPERDGPASQAPAWATDGPGGGLVTLTGQLFGTPAYMSPEQALGETDIDHRTDVWSLGVVLFEMLTGRRPFAAASYPALLPMIAEQDYVPLPPAIPADVQAIIARCLAKQRKDRFQSADALRAAIDRARGLPAGQSVRPGKVERPRTLPSLRPGAASRPSVPRTLIAGGLALAVAGGVAVWRITRAGRAGGDLPPPAGAPIATAPTASPPVSATPAATTPTEASVPVATASAAARPPPSASSIGARPKGSAAPPGSKRVTRVNSAGF